MNEIAIITDSTCDLPQSLIDRYAITVVPHYVIWGNQEYLDRVNLQPEEFYRRLGTDPQRPTSSQATSFDFARAYSQVVARGAQEIVALTVSSAMSGAYQMALNAASAVAVPVHVVDSKGPTMNLGWQVLAAARRREMGGNVHDILAGVETVRRGLVQLVGMDTIEYLQKGGRIGNAVKWVGGILHIKPVVAINHDSGLVDPVGLAHTYKNMIELLYQKFFEKLAATDGLHIAVLHGDAPAEAQALADRIRCQFSPLELLINITGPVLGINTGPRALALCGYSE